MTQLTQHFTLAELTASGTAQRLGLDNTPPPEVLPLPRTATDPLPAPRRLDERLPRPQSAPDGGLPLPTIPSVPK